MEKQNHGDDASRGTSATDQNAERGGDHQKQTAPGGQDQKRTNVMPDKGQQPNKGSEASEADMEQDGNTNKGVGAGGLAGRPSQGGGAKNNGTDSETRGPARSN